LDTIGAAIAVVVSALLKPQLRMFYQAKRKQPLGRK
jgi:hypothetical protein